LSPSGAILICVMEYSLSLETTTDERAWIVTRR
jgi:hypothetical protein